MTTEVINELQIKNLFKQAILEVVQEQKDVFSDLFMEIIEDFVLAQAIEEGMQSETVSESEVFQVLEGTA